MTIWRYMAIDMGSAGKGASASRRTGELAADSAAEVRASLRRIGLLVIDLKPLSRRPRKYGPRPRKNGQPDEAGTSFGAMDFLFQRLLSPLADRLDRSLREHFRRRRSMERAELYDSLATMLESGVPLLEAVSTLAQNSGRRRSMRSMLLHVHEGLRSGDSLASAVSRHEAWFDTVETAMIRAGQHGGTLPNVLRTLADRQERSSALAQKLTGALAYPAIVSIVGLGVVIFLSVKTLPNLVQILVDAKIDTPALTEKVMAVGQLLAHHWPVIGLLLLAVSLGAACAKGRLQRHGYELPRFLRRLRPRVLRRMAVAGATLQLAELLRTGVPLVDALRVVAPTAPGALGSSTRGSNAPDSAVYRSAAPGSGTSSIPTSGGLRGRLLEAAERVERGEDLATALDDDLYFDAEFRRLLTVGETTGELDDLLDRLGHRYQRQAERLIDRLATLLEPAVILLLAVLVGTVVMAAVLPLIRLQEIL